MKKIIMAVVLGLTVPQAHADSEYCVLLAELTKSVTHSRDLGVPLAEVKDEIEEAGLPPAHKKLIFSMVDAIYYGETAQHMAPREVAIHTYRICMESSLK